MSIIFHQAIAQNGGVLRVSIGTGPVGDPNYDQGLMFDDAGAVHSTTVVPPTKFQYGLPFDDDNRLVIEDAPITYYDQGIPFTANNAVAAELYGEGGHYNQGVYYGPNGGLAVEGFIPPPPVTANVLMLANWASTPQEPIGFRLDTDPWEEVDVIPGFEWSGATARWGQPVRSKDLYLTGSTVTGATNFQVFNTQTFPWQKLYTFEISWLSGTDSLNEYCDINEDQEMLLCPTSNFADDAALFEDFDDFTVYTRVEYTTQAPRDCAISPDGQLLVFGGVSASLPAIFVRDKANPNVDLPLPSGYPSGNTTGYGVDFHPTENILAVTSGGGPAVNIYDMDQGANGTWIGSPDTRTTAPRPPKWSPDGRWLCVTWDTATAPLITFYDTSADLRDPSTWVAYTPSGLTVRASNTGVDWSPGSDYVYVTGVNAAEPRLRYFQVEDTTFTYGENGGNYQNGNNVVWGKWVTNAVLPDLPLPPNNAVMWGMANDSNSAYFYNINTDPYSAITSPMPSLFSRITGLDFSYDNQLLAASGSTGLEVYDTSTNPYTQLISTSLGLGVDARVSPDGTQVFLSFSSASATSRIYRISDFSFWEMTGAATGRGTFNHDSTLVFNNDSSAPYGHIWDVTTFPGTLQTLPTGWPADQSNCGEFHPNENILAVMHWNQMYVYDLDTNALLYSFAPGIWNIVQMRWNREGTRLAICGSGSTKMQVWAVGDVRDSGSWSQISVNDTPTINTSEVSWSNDGTLLVAAVDSTTPNVRAVVWDTTVIPFSKVPDFDTITAGEEPQSATFVEVLIPDPPTTWTGLPQWAGSTDATGIGPCGVGCNGSTFMVSLTGGSSSEFGRSTDGGATWNIITVPGGPFSWYGVDGGPDGVWVAVSNTNQIWRSDDDGLTWTYIQDSTWTTAPRCVRTNNSGTWLVADSNSGYDLSISTDNGLTWTFAAIGVSRIWDIAWDTTNDQFIMFGTDGLDMQVSPDGITWSTLPNDPTGSFRSGDAIGDHYMVQGAGPTSNWYSLDAGATAFINAPTGWNSGNAAVQQYGILKSDGANTFVSVQQYSYAAISVDKGVTWTALPRYLGSDSQGMGSEQWVGLATDYKGNWIAVSTNGYISRGTP